MYVVSRIVCLDSHEAQRSAAYTEAHEPFLWEFYRAVKRERLHDDDHVVRHLHTPPCPSGTPEFSSIDWDGILLLSVSP